MAFLANIFKHEATYFQKLHKETQRLIISIFLYGFLSPIFKIFVSAFIFRQSHDFVQVAMYNLALFVAIPVGFLLNGYLLKRYTPNKLYVVGLVLNTFIIASLIFLDVMTMVSILLFGIASGLSIGIYWANRNLLTLKATNRGNRIYFGGLESTSDTISNILIPILIGVFITAGDSIYTPLIAYKIISLIMLLVSLIIGMYMLGMKTKKEHIETLWIESPSKRWTKNRLYQICIGILLGITAFVPTLMVFVFIGKEDALGTIQSLSAVLSALVVYNISKKLSPQHRLKLVLTSCIIGFVSAILVSINFSSFGVYAFFAGIAISWPMAWVAKDSINYDSIEEDTNEGKHYAYVLDQEIFLSVGRTFVIAFFIMLIVYFSKTFALQFIPLIYAAVQVVLYFIVKSLEKKTFYPVENPTALVH